MRTAPTRTTTAFLALLSTTAQGLSAGESMLAKQRWVVVGDVLSPKKPAYAVFHRLQAAGKEVVAVNPRDQTGTLAKSLADATLSDEIEVIDLIINSKVGLDIMREANTLGVKQVFIQPGASSAEIEAFCEANEIETHHGCVLREL